MSMRTACLAGAAALVLTAAACSGSPSSTSKPSTNIGKSLPAVKSGGTLTVLEGDGFSGDWPDGIFWPTDKTGSANQDFFDAIYGQLFDLGAHGKIEPDLATSYHFSPNAETVTIQLRHGVKFSDGTPFNAKAVIWNFDEDLGPVAVSNAVQLNWDLARVNPKVPTSAPKAGDIVATGPYTVVIHQDIPNASFIDDLFDTGANWIASPTAVKKEGLTKFAQYPVGAGPFTVVSDTYNSELVVRKNPHYWEPGHPYLNEIIFKSVSDDEAAYESLLAGDAQVYEDLSTTQLLEQAGSHFQLEDNPGTSPYDLQLNTASAPFNNIKARQAIYAATNFAPILKNVFGNLYPVTESFTGPGGICYDPKVPGYQGYNPTLARKLIAETGLNKVTFNLGTINSSPVAIDTTEALRTEWDDLGMHVTISSYNLDSLVAAFEADKGLKWQAMIQTAGAYDPASGVGVDFRFYSTAPFSGVHSTTLNTLLNDGAGSLNMATRCSYYDKAAEYIARNYDGPFYFTFAPANISVHGVVGAGLTSPLPSAAVVPVIPWQDVYYNP